MSNIESLGYSAAVFNSSFARCRFTEGDKFLVTTGGGDNCVFQWQHDVDDEDADAEEIEVEGGEEFSKDDKKAVEKEEEDDMEFEDRGGGDEFMAVKPWLGAIRAPTGPPDDTRAKMAAEVRNGQERNDVVSWQPRRHC